MFGRKKKDDRQVIMLAGQSWERIAGVMHYQQTLEKIAGGRKKEDVQIQSSAVLIREPNNPHDRNAVAVYMQGQIVGHLPAELAAEYQPFLRRLEEKKQYIGVEALILGGQKSGFRRDQHDFGIRLLLPEGAPR